MPLHLDAKKKLCTHSERVKSVDLHPHDPWVLSALYNGVVMIHNWETQSLVKNFEAAQLPVRCAKFITRKQWIVSAGDDMHIRVHNYNTLEKVKEWEAHTDYIRYLAVHSSLPFILSASDDMSVKLWDWDKNWKKVQTFEGHAHYVMMCQWNPKDPHIFATASLDRTIKVWGIQTATTASSAASSHQSVVTPHFVLSGHDRGINCVEYSPSGEKPYIVSGSDDKSVKVWDYQTKQCIATLTGHTRNISSVTFHPRLPLIISGAEDGTIRMWHSATYRSETTVHYAMDRVWTLGTLKSSNAVAIGFDEGTVVVKLGNETPLASMQGGKIVWTKGSEIQTANLKFIDDSLYSDGERLPLSVKDLGSGDVFPQSLSHHPSGRFIAICGDEEYMVYTAQALRSKAYGKAREFVWSTDGHYAIKDETRVTIFHNFKEHTSITPYFPVETIFGGRLLGLRSPNFICFYDWVESRMIRRIDVSPSFVWWSDSGDFVCLACEETFFVLRHDREAVQAAILGGAAQTEEGIEIAFDLIHEVNETLSSAIWIGSCLVFVTSGLRLQTFLAGQVDSIAFLDRRLTILGYIQEANKLYLIDTELSVVSYSVNFALIEYMCAVCRKDFETASTFFDSIPESLHNRLARFLEHQGHHQDALSITKDADQKFELALSLGHLDLCATIIRDAEKVDAHMAEHANLSRWKQLGDVSLERGDFKLAEACFKQANDCSGLMLLAVSVGSETILRTAAEIGEAAGKVNVAVVSRLLLSDIDYCVEILLKAKRYPDAAFFARSYCPSRLSEVVKLWKANFTLVNPQLAASLADPSEHPELFPELSASLKAEKLLRERQSKFGLAEGAAYKKQVELLDVDLTEEIENQGFEQVQRLILTSAVDGAKLVPADTNNKPNFLDDTAKRMDFTAATGGSTLLHHTAKPTTTNAPAELSLLDDLVGGSPPSGGSSTIAVDSAAKGTVHTTNSVFMQQQSKSSSTSGSPPQTVIGATQPLAATVDNDKLFAAALGTAEEVEPPISAEEGRDRVSDWSDADGDSDSEQFGEVYGSGINTAQGSRPVATGGAAVGGDAGAVPLMGLPEEDEFDEFGDDGEEDMDVGHVASNDDGDGLQGGWRQHKD